MFRIYNRYDCIRNNVFAQVAVKIARDFMHERIDKEVQTLSRLSNNDGIPKVLFSNENSFVMELVCDKIDYFERNDLDKIIDTLQQAHSKGILHRDLRKCNILKDKDSRAIRVVDWGYAVDACISQPFAGGLDCASDSVLESVIERRSIVYKKLLPHFTWT